MTLYLDINYINLISSQLRNFKKKKESLFNCACPFCGDSQKDKYKARGYFFREADVMLFKCHNCGVSTTAAKVIRFVNPTLYQEYTLQKCKDLGFEVQLQKEKPEIEEPKNILPVLKDVNLESIISLSDEHYAKQYVLHRGLPQEALTRIYFTDDWAKWASININEKYKDDAHDHRIVLPFYDLEGNIVGAQGRSLSGDKKQRYVTAKRNDVEHIIFGLDRWNKFETTYIVEGPIDSLFIANSLAVATSDLYSIVERVTQLDKTKTVFVFDNEPFSKEIGKLMMKVILHGYKICIWPKSLKEKDINDMILSGLTVEEILSIIDSNTRSNLDAELEFTYWKRF